MAFHSDTTDTSINLCFYCSCELLLELSSPASIEPYPACNRRLICFQQEPDDRHMCYYRLDLRFSVKYIGMDSLSDSDSLVWIDLSFYSICDKQN